MRTGVVELRKKTQQRRHIRESHPHFQPFPCPITQEEMTQRQTGSSFPSALHCPGHISPSDAPSMLKQQQTQRVGSRKRTTLAFAWQGFHTFQKQKDQGERFSPPSSRDVWDASFTPGPRAAAETHRCFPSGWPRNLHRDLKGLAKSDSTKTPALPGLSWRMIYRCCNWLACSSPRQNEHLAGPLFKRHDCFSWRVCPGEPGDLWSRYKVTELCTRSTAREKQRVSS